MDLKQCKSYDEALDRLEGLYPYLNGLSFNFARMYKGYVTYWAKYKNKLIELTTKVDYKDVVLPNSKLLDWIFNEDLKIKINHNTIFDSNWFSV